MRRGRYLGLLLAASLAAIAAPHPARASERVWQRSFVLPPGGHVAVVNIRGSVLVEGWDRNQVQAIVSLRSSLPPDELADVQVDVETRSNLVKFHTHCPTGLSAPVIVDYRLRVPRQTHLDELSTLAGNILVRDVEGALAARTLHGDLVALNVDGSVEAEALTGDISVSLAAGPDARSPVRLETVSGNVELSLPPRANADLELSTVAGRIESPYPIEVSMADSTRHAQVGAGGALVELRTVRGDVRVAPRETGL